MRFAFGALWTFCWIIATKSYRENSAGGRQHLPVIQAVSKNKAGDKRQKTGAKAPCPRLLPC